MHVRIALLQQETISRGDRLSFIILRPKESNKLSEQTMLFSPIERKLFLGFSHLLKNEMTNNLYVSDSVIMSLCDSVTFLWVWR